jgi:hypothetical protein
LRLGELFVELGIHSDNQKIDNFVSSIRRGVLEAAAFVAGLVGIETTLKDIITGAVDSADSLRSFRNATGESTGELQKLAIAAEKVGIKSDTTRLAVMGLVKEINRVRWEGAPSQGFKLLGIDIDARYMENIANIYKKRKEINDPARFSKLLSDLGMGGMENLFALPQKDFNNILKTSDFLIMSDKQEAQINENIKRLVELKQLYTPLVRDIMSGILTGVTHPAVGIGPASLDFLMKSSLPSVSNSIDKLSSPMNQTNNVTVNIHGTGNQAGDKHTLGEHIKNVLPQIKDKQVQ